MKIVSKLRNLKFKNRTVTLEEILMRNRPLVCFSTPKHNQKYSLIFFRRKKFGSQELSPFDNFARGHLGFVEISEQMLLQKAHVMV